MSAEDNVAVVERINEEAFGQGRPEVADECLAESFVEHNPMPGFGTDRDGFKQLVTTLHQAFPDLDITVEDRVVQGDKVVERWTCVGTHEGDFMGIPATHNRVTVEGIDISRLEGGKVAEHWTQMDSMAMMQQLGAIPSEQGAPA